ncbi:MAG TPA: glycosyltransferase family 4 protein [Polyangia bacterium]|nr:glycosyltransferase family 4 protein [Polyangia bacterium]
MSRPLRVAWIHDRAASSGGIERYIQETARALCREGVESTLLYDVAASPAPEPAFLAPFTAAFPTIDLERQLADLAPDVVYVHRARDPGVAAALARSPFPVVRFFHDHELFCLRTHKYTALERRTCTKTIGAGCYACLGFVTRAPSFPSIQLVSVGALKRRQRQAQSSRAYVVASSYMADHIREHGFDAARTFVLPLFSEPPAVAPDPDRRHDRRLLVTGLVSTGKGIDVLLQALALMKEPANVDVVGDGPQRLRFRNLARRLGLASRVTFHGWASSTRLDTHYREATALVFPSRAPETFGLVGIEAMSYGLPVVASDVGGVREWLRPDETGLLVPPSDAAALARACDRVLASPELARRLGGRGRAEHQTRFLTRHHVSRLLDVFEQVAGAERKAA